MSSRRRSPTPAIHVSSRRKSPTPASRKFKALRDSVAAEVAKVVVGADDNLDFILAAASVGGHVLIEGVPGVAKTLLATAIARAFGVSFTRVQFTPDMLPSDLTGTMTLRQSSLKFSPGPVFTNILLADEINRTPPKTQAALLEAMQEGQVSVAGKSHPLPRPFLVVATQNPIEYEGTYPLPEAQLDRFLMKIHAGYPDDELAMLSIPHTGVQTLALNKVRKVASPSGLEQARREVDATEVVSGVAEYLLAIVRRTRELPSVELGASPRAAVHLQAASKALARLAGRDFVTPDDVSRAALPVLRHRLVLRPEAELERYRSDDAVAAALASVPVPR